MDNKDDFYYHNRLAVHTNVPLSIPTLRAQPTSVTVTIEKIKFLTSEETDRIHTEVSFSIAGVKNQDLHVQKYSVSNVSNLYISHFDFASATVQKLKQDLSTELSKDENDVNVEIRLEEEPVEKYLSEYDSMLLAALRRGGDSSI